jgi:hypothetical protein
VVKGIPIKTFVDVKNFSFIEALLAKMLSYAVCRFLHKQRLVPGKPKSWN